MPGGVIVLELLSVGTTMGVGVGGGVMVAERDKVKDERL